MIKTIKVKKKMRLDELIKYVWDNRLYPETFKSNFNDFAHFDKTGKYQLVEEKGINQATNFTVEVEEEITKDTKFTWLVEASDRRVWAQSNASIGDVVDEETNEIRALINGKLQLIWEAE